MADLTRYAYDARTKAYVGTAEAQLDPLEEGRLLEPAFATTKAPPDAPDGQAAVFNGMGWTLTPDHRGETWFKDTTPATIDFLGDPAAYGLTPDAPPLPEAPPPSSCSKLGLKRAMDERGLWSTVRAMIASDTDMAEDWSLAIEIRITDPIVAKARAGLAQQGIGLSDADVQALVTRANELVA